MTLLSLVIPAYNEEESIAFLYAELSRVAVEMTGVDFEYVFVDDGSTDGTLEFLRSLHEFDRRVGYLSFSRNFGKEAALLAGLERARGDFVAPIDADLQDPPELLKPMYESVVNGGWDCVIARRNSRAGERRMRSQLSEAFYSLFNRVSGTTLTPGVRDFRLMSRPMVDAVTGMRESTRFSKGIFEWIGYRSQCIEYENAERAAGETKWSTLELLGYSLDAMVDFSAIPLDIAFVAGAVFIVAALSAAGYSLGPSARGNSMVWLLSGLVLFVAGVQLVCTGILGLYLSRIYREAKGRPLYIVRESSPVDLGLDGSGSSDATWDIRHRDHGRGSVIAPGSHE